jgi:hypothetical protein
MPCSVIDSGLHNRSAMPEVKHTESTVHDLRSMKTKDGAACRTENKDKQ